MLTGDFTGQPTIYDPTAQVYNPVTQTLTRQSFISEYGTNKIPNGTISGQPNLISPVAQAMQKYFPAPAAGLGTTTNGETVNNFYYNVVGPSHDDELLRARGLRHHP